MSKILHVLGCASPPVTKWGNYIDILQGNGWTVCVMLTPSAASWMSESDTNDLAVKTGFPVRQSHRKPSDPAIFPPPDAILVAPLTFNTMNKWVFGIADNLVLSHLTEALSMTIPIVAVYTLSPYQAKHPQFATSHTMLTEAGVHIFGEMLDGNDEIFYPTLIQAINKIDSLANSER